MRALGGVLVVASLAVSAPRADAFCGFYVNGAGGEMFNDATQVVMMRKGTRTVLAMQNDYRGPLDDFAMVVPVPVVLHEADVKTLTKDVFHKVDVMGAPRLVEYWEQDPCNVGYDGDDYAGGAGMAMALDEGKMGKKDSEYHVKIEAKFAVGEYQIVILSAEQATGLNDWLRDNHYKIPDGAAPLLAPYVAAGSKWFVAKVDKTKVKMEDGRAALSPLRFHYDAEEFALPIRLGLANSGGKQDLIVSILAPDQRYQLANYKNVTIPTNLDVSDGVRDHFGEFYAALFDRTIEHNPGAVVTEYAWDASTCDPCPGPQLDYGDFMTLGADVLDGGKGQATRYGGGFVLTRLHARYGKEGAPDDLVFKEAPAIIGGREVRGSGGKLEERASPSGTNNFQGRYIIRHAWTGRIACAQPQRGIWGGPPPDMHIAAREPTPATNTAFARRGHTNLATMLAQDVPELELRAAGVAVAPEGPPVGTRSPREESVASTNPKSKKGCGCQSSGDAGGGLLVAGVMLAMMRRRRAR